MYFLSCWDRDSTILLNIEFVKTETDRYWAKVVETETFSRVSLFTDLVFLKPIGALKKYFPQEYIPFQMILISLFAKDICFQEKSVNNCFRLLKIDYTIHILFPFNCIYLLQRIFHLHGIIIYHMKYFLSLEMISFHRKLFINFQRKQFPLYVLVSDLPITQPQSMRTTSQLLCFFSIGFDQYVHTDIPVWIHIKLIPIIIYGLISNRDTVTYFGWFGSSSTAIKIPRVAYAI